MGAEAIVANLPSPVPTAPPPPHPHLHSYSAVVLGKSPAAYCEWITKDESWGGEIELSLLCHHFQAEVGGSWGGG